MVFDAHDCSLRVDAEARRRLAPGRARPRSSACKTDDRVAFPFGCFDPSRRPTAPTTPTASARTATSISTTSAARTSSAAAARSTSRCTARSRTGPLGHDLVARRCRARGANTVRGPRRSTSPAPATSTARVTTPAPDAVDAEHEPRRALDRALRCATGSRFGSAHRRLARRAAHPPAAQRRQHPRHDGTPTTRSRSRRRSPPPATRSRRGRSSTRAGAAASRATSRPTLPMYTNAGQAAARREEPAGGDRLQGRRRAPRMEPGGVRHPPAALRRRRRLRRRPRRELHPRPRRRRSGTAASRPRGAWRQGGLERARRRAVAAGAAGGHAEPGARRQAADQRPGRSRRALQARWRRRAAAGGLAVHGGGSYESAREVLPDNSVEIPSVTRSTSALDLRRRSLRRRRLDLARRRRQRLRPPRLARVAVPVQPCLPVPAGAANVADVAAGRPLSGGAAKAAGYNSRLFLDSSVGRAPDC